MSHRATLTYNPALVRRAAFAYWRRTVGIGVPLTWVALTIYGVYLAVHGERSWVLGAVMTVVVVSFLFLIAIFFVHYHNGLAKLRDMEAPEALFVSDNDSFTVSSGMGSSTLAWRAVSEVWRFEDFWLVLFSKNHYITLPLHAMSPEMQEFVLNKVQETGGKVVG